MSEIKKGTPVWAWHTDKTLKIKATYLCYDDLSTNLYKHLCVSSNGRSSYLNVETIDEIKEIKEKMTQLITEAEYKISEAVSKVTEAKKLLNFNFVIE